MRHWLTIWFLSAAAAMAGEHSFKEKAIAEGEPPRRKAFEAMVETAQMFNYDGNPNRYYFMTQMVSVAWEPWRPLQLGPVRVRAQVMSTLFVSAILRGPETFYIGWGPRLRLIFPIAETPWSLYLSGGAGYGYANANQSAREDRGLGQEWTFILQGDGGLRYAINDSWSVWAGMMWHHLSNGNQSAPRKRNIGPDELGFNLGTGWAF